MQNVENYLKVCFFDQPLEVWLNKKSYVNILTKFEGLIILITGKELNVYLSEVNIELIASCN